MQINLLPIRIRNNCVYCSYCIQRYVGKCSKRKKTLTIDSDLAITITVTSGEESLGLLVSECSGSSREVLQEQPDRWTKQQQLKQCMLID